ncbi:LAS superfamily LD-carboxypeptidase LdcB/Sec-independent protein translocase protein TatA [Spinactinospora alkalitolerans]|uniref:LAS superfamily LD-carboxypeptidase LdcB/Sec-independent protein translocase protein TatA n=1 Tax=Spinactinospora alkalitolerans TaxID=687207 RepID=A0A852TPF5_9ACTN|nr:D-alanyl-D-alanine carboxypeptidase family protein [Spinactinospora alkalitolerans]NYE45495.1 LAS superfamily LD-carboxypeptidase LdcB/Sec-independent protein translocase protein TatA [Spinactinospora alkalitolerans]
MLCTLVLTLVLGPGWQVAVAPVADRAAADDLDALKQRAEEAKEELEEATEEYTEREEALEDAQDELVTTLHELQQTELRLAEMRQPLAQLAGTLYKQPDVGIMGIMTSGSIDDDLQAESHVVKLTEDKEAILDEANELRDEQGELTTTAQELQSQTQLERVELADDLDALKEQSEESTERLVQELEDRGLSVDAYMAGVECDPSAGEAAAGYPNGLLPQSALCEVHEEGHFLRADAAIDFLEMNEAYTEQFGKEICLTSSYRDLPNQQRVYAEQPPGNAAVPGTSNHGLGQAVDMCGGVQNQGSPEFNWLEANSRQWGWFHPQWAYSSPFEPWHWEYETGG